MNPSFAELDFHQIVEFYDPHPCPIGALFSVPIGIKPALDQLNGKQISVADAITMIEKAANGRVPFVNEKRKCIELRVEIDEPYDAEHTFRLIKYR